MTHTEDAYRLLQQHLDKQAVGFPAIKSGADIRFLKKLFSPDEARVALHLSYKPMPTEKIVAHTGSLFSAEQTEQMLDRMRENGAIGWKKKGAVCHWFLIPMVVGMYEAQAGKLTLEFVTVADAYMKTLGYGASFLAVKPSQMRTIPINASIPVDHHAATYDQIRAIARDSHGPFAVLECICRQSKALKDTPCTKTTRRETCLAFGDIARMILRRDHGREITRDEVSSILQQNEKDGLVLQCANARKPEFVCSCCGCCCGMLSFQKRLPHPIDFWTSSFCAEVDATTCTGCGVCVGRCQVGAIALAGKAGGAQVNKSRCIGCGLCVPTCPAKAVRLKHKETAVVPPETEEDLYDAIKANKKGIGEQARTFLKLLLRMRQ